MSPRMWFLLGASALLAATACTSDDSSAESGQIPAGGASGKAGQGGASGKASGGQAGGPVVVGGQGGQSGKSGTSGQGGATAGQGGQAGSGAKAGSAGSAGSAGQGGVCQVGGAPAQGGSTGFPVGAKEVCGNGFDDDGNGFVDEICGCSPGQKQSCYPGNPAYAGKGLCKSGTQTCEGSSEFNGWGPCVGAVLPSLEVCEGKNDEDCDGVVDDGCGCCPGTTTVCGSDEGACKPGKATCLPSGVVGACEGAVAPAPKEICGNKLDDNCNGLVDEGCVINVEVDINGDCVCSAPCPPQAPYPVGCQVDFVGGDERGCVAIAKDRVYFQEGDACGSGHLSGKLLCSSEPGDGLNAQNCPINKKKPTYGKKPSDCADASGKKDSCYF